MAEQKISHDKLFKIVFRYFLKDLVEIVEPQLAALLDLRNLKFVDKELFADLRKKGHVLSDLVAETKSFEREPQAVLIHVETERKHLSIFDTRMAEYGLHLTLTFDGPVISIVVFLKGARRGVEIREVRRRVGSFEPVCYRFLALGLSQSLAEDYVDRPQPLAAALAALMRSKVWDRVEQKIHCLQAIGRAKHLDQDRQYVLVKVVETYLRLDEIEERQFNTEMEREANKEVREMVVTWEEALAESRTEGEISGRSLGQLEAAQDADLRVAERRFGPLPQAFEERIRETQDLDRLYRILDRILEASSIDEIDFD